MGQSDPLVDRLRDPAGEVPGGQRLENGEVVVGPLSSLERPRRRIHRVLPALVLGDRRRQLGE